MSDPIKRLLDQWAEALAQVFQSMADTAVRISWQFSPPPESIPEQLWWEHPLQIAPDMVVWTVAPRATWEHAGAITLKAAGLETVEAVESRNTYLEILGQSLSTLARSVGTILGREASCAPGRERTPGTIPETGATISLSFGDSVVHSIWASFSPQLAVVTMPTASRALAPTPVPAVAGSVEPQSPSDQSPTEVGTAGEYFFRQNRTAHERGL